eukprot:340766-Rhodomonas_salina.1
MLSETAKQAREITCSSFHLASLWWRVQCSLDHLQANQCEPRSLTFVLAARSSTHVLRCSAAAAAAGAAGAAEEAGAAGAAGAAALPW